MGSGNCVPAGPEMGAGAAGVAFLLAGAVTGAFCCSNTLPDDDEPRFASIARLIDVTMKSAAAMVVALERIVADPRGPNAVCDPIPPKAPARSAALPLCSSTTTTMKKQMST